MLFPPLLKKGDKISIISTARFVLPEEVEPFRDLLESWGLKVVYGKNIFKKLNQYAGTDEERLEDFQNAIDDDKIKAVFSVRGGYGTLRIIDKIDFRKFRKHPKWICGYSDVTPLLIHVEEKFKIETLHSIMGISLIKSGDKKSKESLREHLFEKKISPYETEPHPFNQKGSAKGILLGGNLTLLHNLIGTQSDFDTKGNILFMEDIDEYLYHIDRMMLHLKRAGKLKNLAGLIVGGFTEMKDNEVPFGKMAYEIIREHTVEYDYPVCFNFPVGHWERNWTLPLGRKVKLEVSEKTRLVFQ